MGKRKEWIEREIDEVRQTITATAMRQEADDQPKIAGRQVVFHTVLASEENAVYAMLHGFSKRCEDVCAQSAGATIDEKLDGLQGLVDHYESGAESWTLKGTRKPVNVDNLLATLLANDPARLEKIMAAAQAAIDAKAANAKG